MLTLETSINSNMKYINTLLFILILAISAESAVYRSTCPLQSTSQTYPVGSCVFENGKNYLVRNAPGLLTGNGQQAEYQIGWVTRECIGNECDSQFLTCADGSSIVNDTIHITKYDTTHIPISINDTTNFAVSKFDTTHISVNVFDTITSVIRDTLRTQISLFDTTTTEIIRLDTVVQNVIKTDTIITEVLKYDTINNISVKYDTVHSQVSMVDTSHINVSIFDTIHVPILDTIITQISLLDTIFKTDTLVSFDTTSFNILDSIYVNNKFFSVSDIRGTGLTKAPMLITQIDTTVIPIDAQDTVILFYDLKVYDKEAQFVNSLVGEDTLSINGSFKQSEIELLKSDADGYLIANNGRKLASGVYIIHGNGIIKVNGEVKSRYYYNSLQGYRRK